MVTKANAKDFVVAFKWAKTQNAEQFVFQGKPVLVSYAKHLIDYIRQMGWVA